MKMKFRIHPIFSELVPAALSACHGILFDTLTSCPHCGGALSGYDVKKKHFAEVFDVTGAKTVTVRVKRFRCSECRAVVYADQPFYQNTRVGSPIVDLCVILSTCMPYARVATILLQFGVNVDRWSVRNYAMKCPRQIPTAELYGLVLPISIISLASRTVNNSSDTSIDAPDILSACGYPSSRKQRDSSGKLPDKFELDFTRFFPSLCCD